MTENRIKNIKKWAEDAAKADTTMNIQVLLGMALAYVNELLDNVETVNQENEPKIDVSKLIKDLQDVTKDPYNIKSPLTQPLPFTEPFKPYSPPMYGNGFTTVAATNDDNITVKVNGVEPILFTYTNTVNLPAEAISDELVESVSNDTTAVDAVLKRLNETVGLSDKELEKVEKVDATEFSKPTKLEALLAEHFEVEKKYAENYIEKVGEDAAKNKVFDNLTPEQRLGLKPFEGTMNDIQVGVPYSQVEKQIKSEQERNLQENYKKQQDKEEQARLDTEDFLKTNAVEEAFTSKYGGTVATIDEPFDGYATLAPGMNESGFIDHVNVSSQFLDKMEKAEQNKD